MDKNKTRELLISHYKTYPDLQAEDIFKYIFQSSFGCEHLVSNEGLVLENIKKEYDALQKTKTPIKELLDGSYSRVHLSCLNEGLNAETLAKLFCLSAKKEPDGIAELEEKIMVVKNLIADGSLPLDRDSFDLSLNKWESKGYPAIRHSDTFRSAYNPAYRVIDNRYADYLQIFIKIDALLSKGSAVVAIEGGSASGKTTLSGILQSVYDCNVFHMDDFFLRPEQRTAQRLAEVGGNVDRERFYDEVLLPLRQNKTVCYRKFDCSTQTLGQPISVTPKKLTIIEGAYSMHPQFEKYYDLSLFLDIDPIYQKERILKRNTKQLAKRFFEEWIPLENIYFSQTQIKSRCSESIIIKQ